MLVGHGIEVSIRGGPDNHEFPRADSSSPFRSARHEHASTLTACDGDAFTIRVTVLEDFQWYQSNALSLEVEYGRTGKLFQLSRIPRPRRPRPITVDLERCYLWVPGPECWRTYATQFVSTKASTKLLPVTDLRRLSHAHTLLASIIATVKCPRHLDWTKG